MIELRRHLSRYIWQFCTAMLIVIALAACNSNTSDESNSALTENCRVVRHAMGETCVPFNPQRIVALDPVMLEATIALDIKPVGSPIEFAPPFTSTESIDDLGDPNAINIERLLALKPDLILGINDSPPLYSQLSQIAPTVLLDFQHSGEWKELFTLAGDVLGKSEEVERVMADYYQRAKEFQQKVNASDIEVSIVRIYPTQVALYTKVGFPGTILEDAGLSRPPSQDLNLEETRALNFSTIQYLVSREVLDKADGDVIFVSVGNWDDKIQEVLASLKTDPLWAKLNAVEQGTVYEVGDYWIGSGAIAANAVLDDLEKYLIGR